MYQNVGLAKRSLPNGCGGSVGHGMKPPLPNLRTAFVLSPKRLRAQRQRFFADRCRMVLPVVKYEGLKRVFPLGNLFVTEQARDAGTKPAFCRMQLASAVYLGILRQRCDRTDWHIVL
jgi:hypothetical protein